MSVVARPMGPLAVLLETDGDPVALAAHVRAGVEAVVDVVPAARTVLVTAAAPTVIARVAELAGSGWFEAAPPPAADVAAGAVEIPVRYDGVDLGAVAERTGLSTAEVVRRHAAAVYRVAFCGFAPGFAYLEGLDPVLHLPRRASPRTRVPAGSVAVAAGYAAVYPTASPGGWHLIGTTELAVWDATRTPPALLAPGTLVRFVPVD